MINYINVDLTVNCDAEVERAVEFLSQLLCVINDNLAI